MPEITEKKPNIFKRMGARIAKFWRDYRSEVLKISWMTWPDVAKNTVLVVVSAVILSAIIAGLDFGFSHAITALGKLV